MGHRCDLAGAPDLALDILDNGHGALGGKLPGNRPAGRTARAAEPDLPIQPVDLEHRAVDAEAQAGALLFDVVVIGAQLAYVRVNDRYPPGRFVRLKPPAFDLAERFGLRLRKRLRNLAPAVCGKPQRSCGGDGRVQLPQAAGRGIPRIGKPLCPGSFLLRIEIQEVRIGHVDLAAHLQDRRPAPALQCAGNIRDGHDVGGHILAFDPVAARGGTHQFALLITERAGQAIDLGLAEDFNSHLRILQLAQEIPDAVEPVENVFGRERVVEGEHRHTVPHFFETGGGRRADLSRRAFGQNEL